MKTIRAIHIFVFVMTVLNLTSAAYAEKYALVIGNGSYQAVQPLDTPVNDANIMASALRDLNFSVEKGTDMSQQEMETAIENFRKRLHSGDTALFYYSGHGVQVEGINYMLPVEISKDKIRYNSVSVNIVLDKMEEAGSKVNIIILDACRSDFKGGKGFGKGLSAMRGGEGTYIAYATAPGTEAYTGTGSTSIFTKHLVSHVKAQGLKIEDMFKRVRKGVMDETSKEQKPWDSSMLVGDFYFMMEEAKPSSVEEYFNIANVASWDFLYIREQPNPNSPKVGKKLNYDIKNSEKEIKIIASKNSQKKSDNIANKKEDFVKISSIPEKIRMKMEIYSWDRRCPVPIDDLSYIILSYWGFDDKVHKGELVVNKKIADEVLTIFKELYEKKFPIERMRLIDEYKGNDNISMADNNTSAFNCRKSTGNDKVFSKHSYGLAIDINPLVNPYIKGDTVLPPHGNKYRDRKQVVKGMIVKGDNCYRAFIKKGWKWGGEWNTVKDYQHFEKTVPE